jgi:hypothetical protein
MDKIQVIALKVPAVTMSSFCCSSCFVSYKCSLVADDRVVIDGPVLLLCSAWAHACLEI